MADARTRGEASGSRRKKRDSPSKQQDRRDAARSESFQTQTQPQPIYSNTRAAPIYAEPEEDLNLRGPRRYSSGDVSSSSSSYIDISRRSPIQRRSAVGFFRSFFAAPDRRRRVKKQRSRASMKLGNSSSSSVDSNLAYGTGFLKKRKERYVSPYGSRRERKTSGIYAPAGRAPGKKRKEKDVETEILEVGAGLAALARKQNRMDLIEARKQGVVHIKREDSGRHGLGVKGVESSRGLGSSKPSYGADEDGWESASDDESCSSSSVDLGLAYGGENTWNWGRPRPPMPVKRKSTIVDPKLFGPQNSLNGVLSRPVGFGEVDINAPGGFMPEPFSSAARDTGYVSPQQPPPAPSLRGKDDGYIPTAGPARRGSAQSSGSLQHVFPMPTDDPLNFDSCRRSVASVQDRPIYNVSRTDSLPLRQPKPFTPVSQTIYEQSSIPAHVDSTPRKRDSGSKRESGSKRDSGGYATFAGAGLAGVALAGMAANRLEKRRNEDDYERAKRRERRNKEVREPEDDRERRRENRRESERYEKSDRLRDSRRDDEQRDYRPDERRERRRGEEREETRTSRQLVSATRPDPFQYQVADDAFEIADRPHKSRQAAADGPSARALEKAPERALGSAPELPMDNLDIGSTIERGHTPDIVTVERVPRFARGGARTSKVPAASTARDDGPSETRGRSREKSPEQIRVVRVVTDEPSAAPSDAAAAEYSSPTKREFKKGKRKSYSASTERERDLIQEDADRVYRETTAANKAAAKEPAPRPVTPENNDEDKEKGPYDSPNADFELDHVMHPEDMPTFSPVVLRAYPASQSCEIEGPFDPAAMGLSRPLLNLVYPTPTPEAQKLRGAKAAPETKDREISDRDIVTVSPSEPKGVKWGEDEVKSFVPVTPHDEAADPIHKAAAPEPVKKKPSRWGDIRGAFIARAAEIKAEEAAEEKARAAEAPASPAEPFEYRGITVEPEHANDRDASLERDLPRYDHRDPGPPPSVGPKPTAAVESRGMPGAFDDDIDFAATLAAGLQDSGFDPNIVINDSSFARRSSPPGSDVETVVYHKPFSETVTDLGVYERHPSGPSDGPVLEEASRKIDEEEFPVSQKLSKKEQKKLEKEEAKRARDHEFDGAEATAVAAVAAAAVAGVAHHYAGEREVAEPEQHADETDEFSFSKKLSKKEQKKLEKEAAKLAMDREFEAAEAEAADHEVVGERTDEADDFAFTKKLSKKEQKKLERDAAKLAQEEEDAAREREHEAMMAQIVVEHEVVGPQDEADEFAYGKKLTKKEQKKLEKEAAKLAQDKEFEDAKAEAANSRAVEEPEEVWGEEAREVPEFFDRGRIAVPGAPQEEIRDEFDDFDAFMPKLSKKEQKKLEKEAAAAKLAEEKELAEAEAAKLAQDKEFAEAEAANNHPVEEPKVQSRELQDDEFKEADEFTKKLSKKEQKKLEKEAAKLAQDKEFEEAEAANSHAVEEPEAWDQEHQEDEFKGAEESAPKLSKIEQKRLDKEAAKLAQDKEFEEVEAASSRAVEEPKAWVQEPQEDEFKEAEEGFVFTKKLSKKEQKKLEKEQAKQARDREIELEEAGEGLHAIVEEPETSKSQGEDDKEADEFAFTKKLSKKEQKRLDKEAENLARDRELELEQTEVPGTQTPKEADEFAEFSTSKKSKKSKKSRKSAGYPDDDEEVPATKISVPIDAFDDLRHDDATAGLVDEWDAPKKLKRMSRRGDEVFEDAQESISRKGSKKDKSRGNADSDRSQIRSVVSEPVEDDTRSVTSESKKKSRGSGFFGFFGGSSNKSDVSESEKAVKLVGADEAYDLSNGHSPIEGSNGISNGNGHEAHEEDEWASTTKSKKKKKKQKNGIADDEASEQDSFLANAGTLGAGVGLVGAAAVAAALHQQHQADDGDSKDDPAARSLPAASQPQNIAADAPRDPYPNDFVDPEIVERPFRVAIDPEYMDLLALPPSDPGTPDPHHSTDLPALPDSRPPSPPGTEHLAPIDRSLAAHDKNPSTPRKTESRKPNRKAASLSAVPLTFKLVNRSTPSSSGLPRPSPLASPLTPGLARPSSLMSPLSPAMDSPGFSRTKARPTSWDNSREIKPLFLLDAARRESLLSDEERPTRPRSIEPDHAVYSRRSSLASARASVVSPRSDDVADLPALPESREASLERVEELPASVEEPTSVLDPLEQPLAKDGDVVSKEVSLEPEADQVKEAFGIERPHSPDQFEEPHEFPELPESRPATPIDDRDLQVSDAIVQEAGDPTTHADGQQDETSREVDDLPQPTPIEPDTCNRSSHLFQPTPQTTPIKHSSIDDIILEHPTQDESGDQDGVAVQERSTTEEQGESYVTRDINVMDVPMAQFDSTAREVAAEEEAEPVDEWSATPSKKAKKDKKKEKKARKGGYQTPPVEKTPEQAALPETLEEQPQQPTEDLSRDLPLAAAAAAAATAAIATFDEEPSASRDLSISDEPSIPVEPVEPEWALKPSKKDKKKAKKSRGDPVSTPADDTPAKSILPEADIEQPPEPLEDFAVEPEWTAKPSKKDKKKGRKSRGGEATPPAEDTTAETILPGGDVEQPVQPAEEFVAEPEWDLKPSKKDKKKANKGFSEQASIPAEDNTTEIILPEAESEQPLQRAEEAQPADEAQPAEDFATEPEWALKPSKKDKKKGKKNRGDQTPVEDNAAETIVREVESEQPVQPADEAQSAKEVQLVKEVLPVEDFIVEPEWALKPSKKDKKKGKKGRGEQTLAEDNTAETTLPVVESDQQIQRAEEVQPAPEELPVEDFVAEPEWALKPSKKDKKKGKKGSGDQTPVEDNVAETILPEADSEQPIQPAEDIVAEPEWALKPSKKDKKKGKKGRGGLVDDTATEPSNSPESAPEPEHLQTLEDEEAAKEIPVDIPVTDLGDEPAPASEQQPKPFELVAEDVPVDVPATTPSDEPKSVSERQLQPLENVAEDAPADIPVTALNDEPTPVVEQELQPYEDATRDANTDIPITAADTPVVESEEPAEPTWALKPSKKDKKKAKKGRGAPVEEDTAIEQQLQPLEDGVKDAPVDMSIAATDDTPVAESEELTEPTWALKPSNKDKKKVKKSRGGLVEDTAAEILDSPESAAPESSAPKSAAEQPPMEDVAVDVLADAPIASPTDEAAPATEPEEPSEPMWALKPSKKDKKKAKKGRSGPVEEDTTVEPLDSLESAVEQPPLEDIAREAPVDIATAAFDEPPPAAESEELSEPTWALKPSKKDKKKAKKGRADLVDEDTTSETLNAPEPTPEQQLQPLEPVDIPVAAIGDELTPDEPVLDKPASDDLAAEEPVPAAESEEPFEPTWALKPSKKDKKKAKKARGGLFEDTAVEQPLEGLTKDAPFDIPIAAPGGDEPTLEELIPDESISAEPTAAPESEEPSDLAEPTWALKPSNKDKKKAKKGRGGPAEDTALEQEEQPLEEMAKEAPIEIPAATLDDETSRDELTADEPTPLAEREEPSGPTWALKPSKKDKKKAKKNREGLFEEDTASEPLDNVAKDIPVEIPLAALGAAALGVATLGDEPTIEQPIAAEPIAVEPAAVEPTPAAESEEPTWALKPSKKDKKKAKKSRGLFEEDTVPEPQGEPLEDVAKDIPIETSLGILSDEPTTVEPTTVEPTTVEPTTVEPTTVEPTTVEPTTVEPTTVEPTVVEPTPAAESEEPTWALKPSKKDKKKAKKSRGLFEEDTVPEPQGEPLEDVAKDIPIETSLGTLSDEPTTVEPTIVEPTIVDPTIVEPTAVETVPSTELEESFELTWALKPSKKDKKGKKSRGVPTEDTAVEPLSAPEVQPSEASANDAPAVLDAPTTALDEEPIAPLVEPEEQIEPQWSLKPSKKDKKGKKAARGGETSAPIEDTIVEQSTLPEAQHFEDSSPIVDAPVSTIEVEPIAPVEPEEQAEPEFALNPSKKDKKRKKAKKAFEDQASTPVEDTCEQSEDLTRDASLIVDTPISALDSEPIAPAESEEQAEPEFALKPSKKDKNGKKGKKLQEDQALSWADEVAETADDSMKDAPLIVDAPASAPDSKPIASAESEEQAEPEFALKPSKKDKKGKKGKKAQEVQALSWASEVAETADDSTKDVPPIDAAEPDEQIESTWAPKPPKKDKKGKKGKKAFEVDDTPELSEDLTKDAPLIVDAPIESEAPIEPEWAPKPSKKDKKAKRGKKAFEVEGTPEPSEDLTEDAPTVVDIPAYSPHDEQSAPTEFEEPIVETFALKSSKKDKKAKKAKKARESEVSTPPVDLNDEATSQTKTVDGFEAGYKEDQLALARQLQAEFGSGSAKSKKSKKKSRGGSQPSAPSTPVEVEAAEVEYFESAPQPRSIDGLKVGYEEDQLSLAKQLQAEFGSGSKKSKKGKKSRGSQGSMPSTPIELETAEVENTECASQPRAFDGLEVGYEKDQLSLAKQLQAEYGSGSKKSKGKKSRGSEVSSPSTPVEVESFESDPQPRAIDGFQVGYDEDQLSLAKQLQAEFGSGSKKSKKGKKNRSSSATPKSNYETYDEEPQAFKSEAATLDSQHDKPKDLDNSPIYEAAEAPRDFQDVRSVEVPQAAEDNSTIEAMVGAAAALGAIGVGAAIKHAVEAPEAPEDKSSHDIIEVPREVSQDPRSLDMPEYPGDTTVPQVVVDALHDLQGSRSIDGADFPEVVASRDLQDFESKPEHMATIHQQEKPEALEELSHPSFPKHVIADREISSPSHVTSDYLSPEPQWHTPSRLPVVLEEDSTDYKKSSDTAPQEHIPLGDSSMDDFNRDSAYVAESPITTSRSLAADHEYTRDSGVHIEGRSRSHTPERRASPPRTPAAVSDDALARLSWPPVNDADETVDLHRPKSRKVQEQSRLTPLSFPPPAIGLGAAGTGLAAARGYDKLSRAGSPDICRSSADSPELRRSSGEIKRMTTPHRIETPRSVSERKTPDINRLHTPDQVRSRPVSATSSKFSSGTPPLRRSDRKTSGDLRSLSQRSQPNLDEAAREARHSPVGPSTSDITNPIANEGRVRLKDMADVYDGYGEGRIGSPRSPTRPHSMRRRQSMQVIDLEARLEQLATENRMLAEAKEQAESNLHQSQRATSDLTDRDAEIDTLKRTLDWFHKEVDRLKEINEGLTSANVTIGQQHDNRYTQLESQHAQATRELEERHAHGNLSEGMAVIIQGKVQEELQDKDRELEQLRNELDSAHEQIKGMQRQILKSKSEGASFLVVRNEDYFDDACQRLCEHVSQWILRFSKFSDMRACRLTSEISNDKIIDRLDNAVLDGSDVDDYLADRVRRRDIFMSMTMTMVWEYIFTRYLFGMDREQRQKLKSLEKMLLEVGPPAAVHQWRATTLSLLARRPAFAAQRDQDTEAVVQAIFQTLSTILPPPSNLEEQIQVQLRRVVRVAVNLSIEMRTQRAQYMMLPPLQPEYDANGDLAREVAFNAALMSEKISAGGSRGAPQVSGEDREEEGAVVQVVLFPLVVKQGDDEGVGEEEIVVCPAQVLVARPREPGSSVGMRGGRNVSRVSIPVSSAMGSEI